MHCCIFFSRLKDSFFIKMGTAMQKRFKSLVISCPSSGREVAVSPRWAARITGRSLRTTQRWATGSRIDQASMQLMQMRIFGVIPWGSWSAFRIRDQVLENVDSGETWTPDQLRASWILFQQLKEYQRAERSGLRAVPGARLSLFRQIG